MTGWEALLTESQAAIGVTGQGNPEETLSTAGHGCRSVRAPHRLPACRGHRGGTTDTSLVKGEGKAQVEGLLPTREGAISPQGRAQHPGTHPSLALGVE